MHGQKTIKLHGSAVRLRFKMSDEIKKFESQTNDQELPGILNTTLS
jgi:hypothetical protein